jgi:DNA-binding XRE family transcriptional regulator
MLNTKYYEDCFEDFKKRWPREAADAVDYMPKSEYAIRITMRDGRKIDYNMRAKGTLRYVETSGIGSAMDFTEEYCRSVFANNLSERMAVKGYGQALLAQHTGLSQATISKYLKKLSTPTMSAARRIAHVLDCTIEDLSE